MNFLKKVTDAVSGKATTTIVVKNATKWVVTLDTAIKMEHGDFQHKTHNVLNPQTQIDVAINRQGIGGCKCTGYVYMSNGGVLSFTFGVEARDVRDSVVIHDEEILYNGSNRATIITKVKTPEELNALGDDYYYGKNGKPRDYSEAVENYQLANVQSDARGSNMLGLCYLNGHHVAKDANKAQELFEKAANASYPPAQVNLALLCNDDARGIELLQSASEQKSANASYHLALKYKDGKGVDRDLNKALELLTSAAESGHIFAKCILDTCDAVFKGEGNDCESVEYDELACVYGAKNNAAN